MMITAEGLREVLSYSPENGEFTWIVGHGGTKSGAAGYTRPCRADGSQYRVIGIGYKTYLAHRLAWLYVYGAWPAHEIDHADLDGLNNRIGNLREATRAENGCNRGINSNNKSGYKGVSWSKQRGKWQARIMLDYRTKFLGLFDTAESAHAAYVAAATELHGEFARVE
jgi:hypothetical protein